MVISGVVRSMEETGALSDQPPAITPRAPLSAVSMTYKRHVPCTSSVPGGRPCVYGPGGASAGNTGSGPVMDGPPDHTTPQPPAGAGSASGEPPGTRNIVVPASGVQVFAFDITRNFPPSSCTSNTARSRGQGCVTLWRMTPATVVVAPGGGVAAIVDG
jgi:hypothetical protein